MIDSTQLCLYALLVPALIADFQALFLAGGAYLPVIAKAVNVIVFFGILYLLLRKRIGKFFADRYAQVRADLERAAKEKEAAMAKMNELDARLNRLDSELAEIRVQRQREVEAERERVNVEITRDIEKLRLAASREIEAAKQVALSDLREFAATKSVDLAEQMIRRELSPEDDARLIERAGEGISNLKSEIF
jgi:F-type H+-transporting ATPase subunit b